MHTVRSTSAQAHKDIIASGVMGKQENIVFEYVERINYSPTRREIATALGMETSTVSARVNALILSGKLEEDERRTCSISKRCVNTLRVAA